MGTTLGHVKGHRWMSLACTALFNNYKIKAGGIPISYDDTVATYAINTDAKLNKSRLAEVTNFLKGVLEGLRIAG